MLKFLALWLVLFLVMLADHELAHVALQYAAEPGSQLIGVMFLSLGSGDKLDECAGALACVTFERSTRTPLHDLLDFTNNVFMTAMLAYPAYCQGWFRVMKPMLKGETHEPNE